MDLTTFYMVLVDNQNEIIVQRFLNLDLHHLKSLKLSVIDLQIRRAFIISHQFYQDEIIKMTKFLLNNGWPPKLIINRIYIITNKLLVVKNESNDGVNKEFVTLLSKELVKNAS